MRAAVWILASFLGVFGLAGCDPDPEAPTTQEQPGGDETDEPETDEPELDEPEPTDEAEPAPATGGRTSPDGMCGGIAGFRCPEGQWCDLDGDYPDASGTCREEGWCDGAADCEAQSLHHVMCDGGWTCPDEQCVWECG